MSGFLFPVKTISFIGKYTNVYNTHVQNFPKEIKINLNFPISIWENFLTKPKLNFLIDNLIKNN